MRTTRPLETADTPHGAPRTTRPAPREPPAGALPGARPGAWLRPALAILAALAAFAAGLAVLAVLAR